MPCFTDKYAESLANTLGAELTKKFGNLTGRFDLNVQLPPSYPSRLAFFIEDDIKKQQILILIDSSELTYRYQVFPAPSS